MRPVTILVSIARFQLPVDDIFAPRKSSRVSAEERTDGAQRMIFEALYRAHHLQTHARLIETLERDRSGDYTQSAVQFAWEIWQIAHTHAIELAAQLCDRREAKHMSQDHKAMCRILAREIRALVAQRDSEDI